MTAADDPEIRRLTEHLLDPDGHPLAEEMLMRAFDGLPPTTPERRAKLQELLRLLRELCADRPGWTWQTVLTELVREL